MYRKYFQFYGISQESPKKCHCSREAVPWVSCSYVDAQTTRLGHAALGVVKLGAVSLSARLSEAGQPSSGSQSLLLAGSLLSSPGPGRTSLAGTPHWC